MTSTLPAIDSTSFSCPHCGALAQQFWWKLSAQPYDKGGHPTIWQSSEVAPMVARLRKDKVPEETVENLERIWHRLAAGEVLNAQDRETEYVSAVSNMNISNCYHCNRLTVWIYDQQVWPKSHSAPSANTDLPLDVKADYDEAAQIVGMSSRGAAALLRLAIQKLCMLLGKGGKDLNSNIAEMVRGGLDPRIQQALDIVRVVGNNSVHPGQIDLRDNRDTAMRLFDLVNLIADNMISQPKHIEAMYSKLPSSALKQIESRDKPKP